MPWSATSPCRCSERGADIALRTGGPAPFRLRPLALLRLAGNLINNALRYGGAAAVEVATRREADQVLLEVMDRGPGIPPEEAERLKQPFTRLEAARTGAGGAGLGLAIVERIARSHGGRTRPAAARGRRIDRAGHASGAQA
jgi:two-component system osmolarity sensor histidine kinase EnvZ